MYVCMGAEYSYANGHILAACVHSWCCIEHTEMTTIASHKRNFSTKLNGETFYYLSSNLDTNFNNKISTTPHIYFQNKVIKLFYTEEMEILYLIKLPSSENPSSS